VNRTILNIFVPLILTLVLLTACGLRVINGSGDVVTEDRDVSGFDSVEFAGFGRLILTQGNNETLSIEVDDNLLRYIDTRVVGDTLKIDFDDNIVLRPTDNTILFRLNVIELSSIDVSGAGTFEIDELEADQLEVTMSGAGKVEIDSLTASFLEVVLTGAGNVDLSGEVERQVIRISGFGDFDATDLESKEASVTITGAGDVDLWVHSELDVDISGAGSVSYYGDPDVSKNVSGAGRVNSRGDK
jgi:hypothetical protein